MKKLERLANALGVSQERVSELTDGVFLVSYSAKLLRGEIPDVHSMSQETLDVVSKINNATRAAGMGGIASSEQNRGELKAMIRLDAPPKELTKRLTVIKDALREKATDPSNFLDKPYTQHER